MKMRKTFLLLFSLPLVLLAASNVSAEISGADLGRVCGHVTKEKVNVEEIRDVNFCIGYVAAYIESHYSIYLVDEDRGFCLGRTTSYKDVASKLPVFLESHPEYLNQGAYFVLGSMLGQSFPCN